MSITMPTAPMSRAKTKIIDGYDPDTGTWEDPPTREHPNGRGYTVPKLLAALRTGCSLNSAAAYARTSYATVARWREQGRMIAADPDVIDRMDLDIGERVYVDLAIALDVTFGTVEVELATLVRQGCRDKPELALAVLSRRYPHWREKKDVDVTTGGAALVQDRIAGLLTSDPKLATIAEEFSLALEAAAGDVVALDEDE